MHRQKCMKLLFFIHIYCLVHSYIEMNEAKKYKLKHKLTVQSQTAANAKMK